VVGKTAVSKLSPFTLGFLTRFVVACVCLGLIFAQRRGYELRNLRTCWRSFLVIGAFNTLFATSTFLGLRYTTAANAAILMRTDILFTLLIGYLLAQGGPRPAEWLGVGLMVGGIGLVMRLDILRFDPHQWGNLLFLAAGLLISVNGFLIQVQLRRLRVSTVALFNNTICAALFLPVLIPLGLLHRDVLRLAADPRLFALAMLLGALTLVILFYYYAIGRLTLWLVRVLLLLAPASGVVFSRLFLHERLTTPQIVGMTIMLGGAAWILWRQGKKTELIARGTARNRCNPP